VTWEQRLVALRVTPVTAVMFRRTYLHEWQNVNVLVIATTTKANRVAKSA
jgi:hypothetical protein